MAHMNKEKNCKGKCPFCGSEDLEYGVLEIQDELLYYPFTCNDCDKEGEEWYDMEYATTTYTEEPEEIKTNEAVSKVL
jgi:endogenous inhibitor of DNA gyrase (YacG/DUF329 family)